MTMAESMRLTADEIIRSREERRRGEEERLKEFKAFQKELKEGIEELKEVHLSLKKGEEERLKEFTLFNKRLKKETSEMLKEFKADQKRAASEWARVVKAIAAKKEARLSNTKKIEKEERVEVISVKPKKEEIEGNLLEVLQRKSNGMTLQELSSAIGVHYVTLGTPIKDLMEKGKVKKEEHLYFAVQTREKELAGTYKR